MARRSKTITLPGVRSENFGQRDNGKTFVLTEMDAVSADDWAIEALLSLTNAGAEIPDAPDDKNVANMAQVASAGLKAISKLSPRAAKPLLARLMECVQYKPDLQGAPLQALVLGTNCQIEEMATFWTLRLAVFELHTGFSLAETAPTTE